MTNTRILDPKRLRWTGTTVRALRAAIPSDRELRSALDGVSYDDIESADIVKVENYFGEPEYRLDIITTYGYPYGLQRTDSELDRYPIDTALIAFLDRHKYGGTRTELIDAIYYSMWMAAKDPDRDLLLDEI